MKDTEFEPDLTLFDALLGLLTAPTSTTQQLLSRPNSMLTLKIGLATLLILVGPIVLQLLRWNFLETRVPSLLAVGILFVLTALLFTLLEWLFLKLLSINIKLETVATIFVYACAPLAALALGYYVLNLIASGGRLTITTYLITGVPDAEDWLLAYFPALHLCAKLWFLYVLYCGIQCAANLQQGYAALLTLFSSIPFYISLLAVATWMSILLPGSLQGMWELALASERLLH
jgi:hypothetical protein